MALTYGKYLHIDELMKLQIPRSEPAEHDEYLFIVIHQTYELWFRLLFVEFDKVKMNFSSGNVFGAISTLKRCRTIMKTLVGQMDILETMTPVSFLSFRDRLDTASGFQSVQFRALEFMLGYKRPEMIRLLPEGEWGQELLEKYLNERSVVDHFYDFLETEGVTIPEDLRTKDVRKPTQPSEPLQAQMLDLYRSHGEVTILFELMTDFDEGLMEWRYRHVKLVERTIGNKKGTGGSLGADYLKASLFKPVFPDLWAIRHEL